MKVEGVQCDVCDKMISTKTSYLHSDWFTVIRGDVDQPNDELHFCCLRHLRDWIEKQVDIRELVNE